MKSRKTPLKYLLNPCDIDHYKALTPVQKFFEFFSQGTDCKCCLGARVVIGIGVGTLVGTLVGLVVGAAVF